MEEQTDLNLLKGQSLLQGLSDEQIARLKNLAISEEFSPNDAIIEEEDNTTDVYLIVDGAVNVLKWDEQHSSQALIGSLGKGEMFGEMSFMDASPRSTTIKAMRQTRVLKLSKEAMTASPMQDILSTIFANIAIANINRLRQSNKLYVRNLENHQQLYHVRQETGKFLIYQYILLALSACLALSFFPKIVQSHAVWLIDLIPAAVLIPLKQFPWGRFGLNLRNWPAALLVSCFVTVFAGLSVYFLKATFLINGLSVNLNENLSIRNVLFLAVYCFSAEFIGRGILQTSVQEFFQDHHGYKSALMNACFIAILLFPLGYVTMMNVFMVSFSMGLLFAFQKTILGVFIIHFLLVVLGLLTL